MEIQDIINYVNESPCNTNENVLRGMLEELTGGGGSGLGVFKVTQSVTGYDHTSVTLNVWYAHDNEMTWQEFVDSEYNPVYHFGTDEESQDVYYDLLFVIDGNAVKMRTYYELDIGEAQEIVGATPTGVIDDTANYTATFNFAEGSN